MIKINIVAVGKVKEKFFRDAIDEYLKRSSKYAEVSVIEAPEGIDEGDSVRLAKSESEGIIKRLKGFVVLLDLKGKAVSSEEISALIQDKSVAGVSEFSFVIGGSRGVSQEVKDKADVMINFGRVTYPHQLMRVIVSEQIYRALTIINKASYHK